MLSLDKDAETLCDFGLTSNQAKVYLAVVQLGAASISQVSKVSKVRREEVYRMLPTLGKMGLTEKILGKPIKVRATPVEEALSILISREQEAADKKVTALKAKTEALLEQLKAYKKVKPTFEDETHFILLSQRDLIINKVLTMTENAQKEIDLIISRDEFTHILLDYVEPLKKVMEKGVKVRIVLEVPEYEDSVLKIIKKYGLDGSKASRRCLHIKYVDELPSHYITVDDREALISTSKDPRFTGSPALWTDDVNLVGLLQRNFEEVWHSSVNASAVQTKAVSEKVTRFVGELRPRDHVIFVYETPEAKHNVLFNYLKAGIERDEAAAYVAAEESPSDIREAMKGFGIDVENGERTGALRILAYSDVYIINKRFDIPTTVGLWNKLYNEALKKGFKGLRVTGEMACFFQHGLTMELMEYERELHRILDIPITAICAYNARQLTKVNNPISLYTELVRAHGIVLFAGVDNKLGKIEIRKA